MFDIKISLTIKCQCLTLETNVGPTVISAVSGCAKGVLRGCPYLPTLGFASHLVQTFEFYKL